MQNVSNRINTVLLLLVLFALLVLIGMVATRASAGPLDPPSAPAPTGAIHEAESWSQTLTADGTCNSPRFKCVMNNEGILDRETGLVWQRTAGSSVASWNGAVSACINLTTGSRMGWRLPTMPELKSIANLSGDGAVTGMPFLSGGVPSRKYWSATTDPFDDPAEATYLDFNTTTVIGTSAKDQFTDIGYLCVRGPDPGAS